MPMVRAGRRRDVGSYRVATRSPGTGAVIPVWRSWDSTHVADARENERSLAKGHDSAGAGPIAFASCIAKGTPIGFPCPHFIAMKEAVRRAIGPDIPVIDFTH